MDRIRFDQLSAGSIFKIAYFCLLGLLLPLGILCGVLAMLGSNTVSLNGQYVHGVGGLVGGVVIGLLVPLVFAAMTTLGGLIARFFGGILPQLTLRGGARAEPQRQQGEGI